MIHDLSPAVQGALRRGQLRRAQRHLSRLRAVRSREGCVHRREGPEAGSLRDRRPRHDLPRRDRRPRARAAAQAPQGARDQDLPPAGRHPRNHGGRAAGRGDEQGAAGRGRERTLPRRPVLPAQRDAAHAPGGAGPLAGGPPRAHHSAHVRSSRRAAGRAGDALERSARAAAGAMPGPATCARCATSSSAR